MLGRTIEITRRRHLPQWQTDEGTYFVTFRLFDALPADLARIRGGKRVEAALDRGCGSAHLANPAIGEMVFTAIQYFHNQRYVLHSAVVMPNHVHAVLRTTSGNRLSAVLYSWKSYTGRRANVLLGREGTFWQQESFTRLIRDVAEFERANTYVLANPEKAGLHNWPWVARFDPDYTAKYVTTLV